MKKISDISFGLGSRIALFSWLLVVFTLAVFVAIILPQQKASCLRHLESKSNGVAVSLHDALSEAVINDDFASLVSASQALMQGDPEIEFVVIAQNNGFAIINQQKGWSTEKDIDRFWLPETRRASGGIETVPTLKSRVFHHAQPFDYSGIEWGWFHVGLSLDAYEQNLSSIYRQIFVLVLSCIVVSLIFCLIYAHKLVQPIIRLREVVHQIASGNFNVRVQKTRKDEIGFLADSVNIMADGLLHRDILMDSVRWAAQHFLHSSNWETVIPAIMEKMGQSINVSRVYLFKNYTNDAGQLCMSRQFEWVAENIPPQITNSALQNLSYAESGLGEETLSLLKQNEVVSATLSEMGDETRAIAEHQGVYSLILVPVLVDNNWWGYIGMDDCLQERTWLENEQDSLRAVADMLGATITRHQTQQSLLEAKATLEERVEKRTVELQNQVTAKERALDQLAATQSSLLEMSRTAGMAEVATGVLHNVGNVLNSVNVSSNLIREQISHSRIGNIGKVVKLLNDHEEGLPHFLTEDPRGKQIPVYLDSLDKALQKEQRTVSEEVESLHQKIDHIKEIVSMQQTYGQVFGVVETIAPEVLMEDALTLNSESLARHQVEVVRDYEDVPAITVDKHTILQILLNFINNAKYACLENDGPKRITLHIFSPSPDRVAFQVQDTGVGILPENMNRIFQHGFTTRKEGHGFGLHSGALAARNLGGLLTAASDGPGCGATFTLEIPVHPGEKS
ncbi:MAG: histidine kinase [Proteobacteria bacterium]|nr:MAG: histidine kinase [Pseudomonadota bacterium]